MRHRQEHELEFRYDPPDNPPRLHPDMRGLVVWAYGNTLEKAVEKARERFNLDCDWVLVRCEHGEP